MKSLSILKTLIAASVLSSSVAAMADVERVPLYQYVTESHPVVIMNGPAQYVESVDVNWRGATGRHNVNAEVIADGQLVWSGLIPPYDPTFHATVRTRVSTIELRVSGGDAYVNWASIYLKGAPLEFPAPTDPSYVGSLLSASELARELIATLAQLERTLDPILVRDHLMPLKLAAASVYAVSASAGGMRQIDTYNAVYGLELVFRAEEGFFQELLAISGNFAQVMNLMTIRERYRALFGATEFPN